MEEDKSHTFSCLALNSRPSIQLKIYDQETNIDIELLNYISILKSFKTKSCDEKHFCNTSLTNLISFTKDINRKNMKLACRAENTTSPFLLSTDTAFSVNITKSG